MSLFKKASKAQSKLRLALFGVSGGGKTYSALRLATGLGGRIAVIDTEHGSASKYADKFDFDVCTLDNPTINNLLMTIDEAKSYDVLIIDSLTHAWNELLKEVEQIARSKFGGNTWSAWSEGTPKQMKLINAILDFKGHVIATMRAETNWTTQTNDRGKLVPVRVGEAPKQGKGIEYEFDMLIQLSQDHSAYVLKDRTSKYQDACLPIIDEEFGKQLNAWLSSSELDTSPQVVVQTPTEDERTQQDPIFLLEGEELVESFKRRISKILKPGQIRLFMKQNGISVKRPDELKQFLYDNDLELTIAAFEEETRKEK